MRSLTVGPGQTRRHRSSVHARFRMIIVLFTLFMDVFDHSRKMTFVKITKREWAWKGRRQHLLSSDMPNGLSREVFEVSWWIPSIFVLLFLNSKMHLILRWGTIECAYKLRVVPIQWKSWNNIQCGRHQAITYWEFM